MCKSYRVLRAIDFKLNPILFFNITCFNTSVKSKQYKPAFMMSIVAHLRIDQNVLNQLIIESMNWMMLSIIGIYRPESKVTSQNNDKTFVKSH